MSVKNRLSQCETVPLSDISGVEGQEGKVEG